MIPNDDLCNIYKIQEGTKNEFVSVGSNGNILRWCDTGGDDQKWLIIPVDENRCRIMTKQNGEYMAVGSNGDILRWGFVDDNSQLFSFVNGPTDGWWNIQESTRNEYVSVGSNGNILRWASTCGNDQKFKLVTCKTYDKPQTSKGQYSPQQIPDIPRITGFSEVPPERSEAYKIGETVLSSMYVKDSAFNNLIMQVESNPYYILVREQYWDRTGSRGYYHEYDGRHEITDEIKIVTGITQKTSESIENTLGIKITASGEFNFAKKGSLKAGTELSYQLKLTYSSETETMKQETHTVTIKVPGGKHFATAYWTLVDCYTLKTVDGREVDKWEVVKNTIKEDSYPSLND